jgi:anaerobic magnesium-protoporphyrin IX monomethyl ester cyclase
VRVLLVQPYITVDTDHTIKYLQEPIGLLSIATYIESELGDTVKIGLLDLFALGKGQLNKYENKFISGLGDEREICEHIRKFNPEIVGITANFTELFQDVIAIGKLFSTNFRNIKLVLGGNHATIDAKNILQKYPFVDYIIRREGEVTFLELIQTCMKKPNCDFSSIKGLTYREGEEIISNEDRPLIKDINILPMVDRELIDMDFYKEFNYKTLPIVRETPVSIMFTSRGCPFKCVFCSSKFMWEREFRSFTPERVLAEIKNLYHTYGIKEIAFCDDQFFVDKKRAETILDDIIDLNLGISFSVPSGTSSWILDENLLRKMKKAGFYRLCFPIESGNKNTVNFIKKPINLKKVLKIIKLANRLGYWTSGNFIIGFPHETREEIITTIKYAYECGVDFPIFFIAQPLIGSDLHEIVVSEGLLKKGIDDTNIAKSKFNTNKLSMDEINILYQGAVKGTIKNKIKFYLKPANFYYYLLPKLRTYRDIKYFMKLFYNMFIKSKLS